MNNEKYKSTIGFTDLLFNILVGFAFLFIIAFLLIKPEAKKEDFERKAEFIVTLEWDHDAPDDIDLYVQDPQGGIVSYRHPTIHFMHLDKDDLGSVNDTVMINGRRTTISLNREVVSIRGFARGEYIVNAHYYSNRRFLDGDTLDDNKIISVGKKRKDGALTVKVEVIKVNPYAILWVGDHIFDHKGQEETFVRFRLDEDGMLLPPVTFQKKNFITPIRVGAAFQSSSSNARPPSETTSPTPSYLGTGASSDLGGPGMEEDESSLQRLLEQEEEEQDEFGGAE